MIIHESLLAVLEIEGLAIVPKKLTPAIACALEMCAPPEAAGHTPEGLAQLVKDYQDVWSHALAAATYGQSAGDQK